MRKFVLSCLFMIVSLSLRAADYYWVGGAGAWDDLNHWATTSGGTSKRSVVPSSGDDVFFDVNSGLANGNIVTLPASGAAYCHNISWLGVTTTASFRNNGSSRLYVYGNVELAALVTYGITIEFAGGGVATYKINGANKVAAGWYNSFAVNKPNGTVKLLDNIPLNFGVDNITLTSGMVDLSGGNHVFTHLYGNTGGLVRGVNITGATITMAGAWDLQGPNVTVIGDNSYISAQLFHSASGYYPKVDVTAANSGAMKIYNTGFGALTFTSAAAQSGASVVLQGNTIRRLEFKGAGTLGNANNTIDTLIMAPGKVLQVYGAQTINKFLQMKTPDCSGLNQIQGKDIFAKLNFSTGAAVDLYNVYVGSMIATGSITPLTFQGIDGGGNTGFNIQPPGSGITLYWVGGAGDWNDINHWSTTSGGPGGACLPLTADDVVFDSNSGFAPGSIVTTTTNAWCHNMTWRNITAPVTFNKSISYSMEVWGSLVMHPSVTMNADLLMKGQEASTLTTNGSTLGLLKLNILKTGPNGGVTLIDNFTNIQATVKAITGKLIMANQTLDINEFASIGTAIRAVDITNTTITTHYIWITTDTACTWVNNGAGSFITSQGYLIAAGLTYPKVYCTSDKDYFRISRANIGELQFTNTSPSSLAGIDKNNNIGTLEFKGAGNIRNAGNSIMRLLLAPSRRYNFSGSNTIQEHLRLNSPDCGVMGEIRSKDANPAILQFSPGVTFNLANVYIQNMTATGSGVPLSVTGVDAGGNSGFNITTTGGNSRYWVGGSGEWNDPSHWSATSGGAGGACVPTIKDDVYFDANSFTSGSSNVKIASGQAYCRNMDWTGASFNPVFDHDATLTLEVWGNLQMNPSVTMNTVLTFEGASNNTITTNGSNTGKFSIYVVKPGISNVLRIMDDFSNPNTRITLKSGGLDLSGINVQVNIITDDTTALATSMNITNARIATNWTYFGANKNLQASGSTLTVPYFIVNGGAYNRVDVTTYVGGQMNISKTTIEDLVFSNTNATTGAFIGGNNQINRLEFKSRGTIGGPSNTIGTLIFTPGKVYTFAAGSNTTITNDWFGSGTPCNLTEFISASSTVNATITKTGSNISFDYVRVKGITAAGTTPFAAGEHSTDQGGNVKWDFKPYNGSAPISGLGPDITLCTEQFPYILKTDGFFASPTSQYKWNDGSANSTLTATKGGTYSVQVSFSDGCTVSGQIVITEIKLAVAPITGTTNICVGSTTTLGNTTAGGTWSSSDATIATIDANGIVTGVSTGTATITYEVTNANGCKAQQTATVTVNALPVVSPITGTTSICMGVATTLSNTTPGGVWSSGNTAVATVDANSGLVTGVTAGTATITYEVTNANGCKAQQTAPVTVNALPVVSPITGTTNICTGTATTLSNTTSGGVWSSSNTAVATVDANSGLVTGVTAGTATITYEVTNANGCKAQQTAPVTVNALPVVSPITGTTSMCIGSTTTLSSTTANGIWSSSNSGVATIDANSGLVTGVSAGTVTITYEVTNANGCKASQTATVTVNTLPVVSPITGTTSMCMGTVTTLSSTTTGGVWSSSNTTVATIDVNGLVTGVAAGTTTITYEVTSANGCKAKQTATVAVNALPVVSPITGTTSMCLGAATTLSSTTTGGVWSSSNNAVATIDVNGLVTGVSAGTTTITYEVTNANGCKAKQIATVTVNALPVVSPITGTTSMCMGAATTLSNTTTGGVWSSSNTAIATVDANSGLVTGVSAGTATITYEVTNGGCKAQQTTTITVKAQPVVSPITGTTSMCMGATTTLSSTTTGGVWSSSNTGVATIDANTGLVTGVSAGTATITYEVTNANGCKAEQTVTVTVNALPVVSPITGTTNMCIGAATTLSSTTTGGVWSSSNTGVATIDANTGLVTGVSAGTTTITYEVTNANGCKAEQTATVTVNALPVVSPITGTTNMCMGAATTLSSTTTGGVWSSSNTAVATIDVNGLVTGVTAGTTTITYEVTNANGCKTQQTATITVNALPVVSPITGTTSMCIGTATTLSSTTPGGVWSSSNTAVATIDVNGLVTGVSAGSTTITYEVTNANGCKAQQIATVTVNALPVISPITGTTSMCMGGATTLTNTTPGGVWSNSNTAVATIDVNGLVTGVSAGTTTITYEVTNANGCKTQQTATVTVNALPVVSPITGTTSMCIGAATTLSSTTPGGVWSSSNTAVATIDVNGLVTGVSAGTTTITYEVTNANGCKAQQIATVTVNALPVVSPITGTTSMCIGTATTLSSTTPGGVWRSINTTVATIDVNGLVTGVSAGTTTITYEVTNANGCKAQQTTTITVNALPVVSPITGTTSICMGAATTLSNTTTGGVWSSSNTAVATIDVNGLVTGVSAGTATITYEVTNANGCKAQQTATITVNALPVVSPITGTTNMCVGAATTLSNTTPGGVWSSSNTAVATIDVNGLVTGVSAGTTTITYEVTNANGCKAQQIVTVTVNALPVVSPITGTTNLCMGAATTLSNTTPGGVWSSSKTSVATIDVNGLVTGVSAGTATITYEVTNANGCKAQQTATVTVNALPVVSPITGAKTVCVGGATTLSNNTPGGTWISNNPNLASIEQGGIVTGLVAGTITITYQMNATGCLNSASITMIVSDCNNTTAPVAHDDAAETYVDTPITINVLNNDSQQNGTIDPASVHIVRQPTHGSVTVSPDGRVVYTPAIGYNGSDNFVYTVKNTAGLESNQAIVQITIFEEPVAVDDEATTSSDKPVTIPVLANDRGKINPQTVTVTMPPIHGSVTVITDGTITYTPARKYAGKDNFRYQFKDINGKISNEGNVNIDVDAEELYIPNAITPNNDGKNDRFVIPGISKYPGSTLTIFNRWGNEVYYSPNYDNRWDGNGLSGGTYYYILKLNTGQDTKVYKGWIQLLR